MNGNETRYSEAQLKQTLAGKAVFFAEDQLTIQMLTKNVLTKAGAEVTVASNGQQALEAFSGAIPDIVITDAMMPEMDGYELSARLREKGYAGPIIAVTAATATIGDECDRLIAAGADVVLPKPMRIEEVKLALAEWEQNISFIRYRVSNHRLAENHFLIPFVTSIMIRLLIFIPFLIFMLIPSWVVASVFVEQAKLYPRETVYDVYRKGELIGAYRLAFDERSSSDLSVNIDMQLDMKVFSFFRYQYRYQATEYWENDQLTSLSVLIDSNGKQQNVSGLREKGQLKVIDVKGKPHQYDGDLVTTHHWFDLMLGKKQILNTIKGTVDELSVQSLGRAALDLGGETIEVNHFSLGGDLKSTETWYDQQGRWRALKFDAKDGSEIQLIWRGAQFIEGTYE